MRGGTRGRKRTPKSDTVLLINTTTTQPKTRKGIDTCNSNRTYGRVDVLETNLELNRLKELALGLGVLGGGEDLLDG